MHGFQGIYWHTRKNKFNKFLLNCSMVSFTVIIDKISVLGVKAVVAVATKEAAEAVDMVLVLEEELAADMEE